MVTPGESIAYQTPVSPAKQINDTGLCQNCLHVNECTLRRNPDEAIVACEEHEIAGGTNLKLHRGTQPKPAEQSQFLGLCMNCDIRAECTLPKAEAGVWHCEEYV
ncbi:MAG: hypothetical protein AUJ47_03270 [Candidatus Marinimicrobia bacterium CG1_02_48_14]|nr:MAG: hypothetical protein AUJ47_03270 [Candidatus Marinimicrobia bacterium CG1_02_48_14]